MFEKLAPHGPDKKSHHRVATSSHVRNASSEPADREQQAFSQITSATPDRNRRAILPYRGHCPRRLGRGRVISKTQIEPVPGQCVGEDAQQLKEILAYFPLEGNAVVAVFSYARCWPAWVFFKTAATGDHAQLRPTRSEGTPPRGGAACRVYRRVPHPPERLVIGWIGRPWTGLRPPIGGRNLV